MTSKVNLFEIVLGETCIILCSKKLKKQVGRPVQDAVFKTAFKGGSISGDLDEILTALGELNDELIRDSRY